MALIGMFVSTKIHQDGCLEEGSISPSTEISDEAEVAGGEEEEETEREVV